VVRWALASGTGLLAVVSAGSFWSLSPSAGNLEAQFREVMDLDYATAVLLAAAAVALVVGTAALPQFRWPAWLTAVACVVALVPVAVVATDAAGERDLLPARADQLDLFRHLAPGLLATMLAGLVLVLAVSRADRSFLVPAGALLVQLAVASRTWGMSGAWYLAETLRGIEVSSAFLEPGLRTTASTTAAPVLEVELGAALATAAMLLGPALIAVGAARTAGIPAVVHHPAPAAGAEDAGGSDATGGSGDAGPADDSGSSGDARRSGDAGPAGRGSAGPGGSAEAAPADADRDAPGDVDGPEKPHEA
jgi:hypothetical protein